LKSAWTPPGDEKVDVFMRLLRADLVQFDAAEHRSNLTWIDRKASAWLKQHVDTVAVIDADKGLGDAIVLRSWVHQQVLFQLSQGYVQLSDAEVQTKMRDSKFQADALIQFFLSSSTISLAVAKFLLSKFYLNYAGTFRILAKVHKFPMASRPICNLRGMWLAPLATFLVEVLNPLIANLHTVIVSTDQLLSQLRDLQVSPDMAFVTLDIVNLYPSVDRSHFMSLVSSFLHSRIQPHSLCVFVVRLLELVLDACLVTYGGKTYASNDGIPTGLAVAGTVANIYLWHLDGFIETESNGRLQFLRRYIDDLLLLWAGSADDLRSLANGWHPSLRFEVSGAGDVNFLDVELQVLDDQSITWSLFNKPQNLHLYVPATSCHPVSTFKSLQIGGFLRCFRRNRRAADVKRSLVAFKRHLRDRGYCISDFNALVAKHSLKASRAPRANSKCKQVFLKVQYAQNMTSGWLQSKIRKLLPLLRQSIPEVGIGLCWAVGRNLFRRRYGDTWKVCGRRSG